MNISKDLDMNPVIKITVNIYYRAKVIAQLIKYLPYLLQEQDFYL